MGQKSLDPPQPTTPPEGESERESVTSREGENINHVSEPSDYSQVDGTLRLVRNEKNLPLPEYDGNSDVNEFLMEFEAVRACRKAEQRRTG